MSSRYDAVAASPSAPTVPALVDRAAQRAALRAARQQDYVRDAVQAAPPLSDEKVRRLALLLERQPTITRRSA